MKIKVICDETNNTEEDNKAGRVNVEYELDVNGILNKAINEALIKLVTMPKYKFKKLIKEIRTRQFDVISREEEGTVH